jgi:hypothetical protein
MRSEMFAAVRRMNDAFGNPEGEPTLVSLAMLRQQVGTHESGNVLSELKEFTAALEAGDVNGMRDALCDIMVFVLGAYHRMGFDADADMEAVVEGVMTRFCRNEQELADTVAYWAARGVTKVYTHGRFPTLCVKSSEDQVTHDGDTAPAGKFLKSTGYRDTVFPPAPVHGIDAVAQPVRAYFGQRATGTAKASHPQRRKEDNA